MFTQEVSGEEEEGEVGVSREKFVCDEGGKARDARALRPSMEEGGGSEEVEEGGAGRVSCEGGGEGEVEIEARESGDIDDL